MKIIAVFMIAMLILLSGCNKDIPEPEVKSVSVNYMNQTFAMEINHSDSINVKHQIKGNQLFIECIVEGVTFRETEGNDKGKIVLYVDGKKKKEISSAAFIVKGLSKGNHQIKLEFLKENQPSYMVEKEFNIVMP